MQQMKNRPDWDSYFMGIAQQVSQRATCPRRYVGVVLVRDRMILSTGYNGSIPGAPHCEDIGCDLEDGHCVRTVHAEVNAVAQAARYGVSLEMAIVYSTLFPCWSCFKTLVNAGVSEVVYGMNYGDIGRVLKAAEDSSITIWRYHGE